MKVLFVCVHNSGRSQMAEAFTRTLSGGTVDACSAGTIPDEGLNPVVAEVMEERGIRDEVEARVRAMLADMGIDAVG